MRAIFAKNRAGKGIFQKEKRSVMIFFGWQAVVAVLISIVAAIFFTREIAVSVFQGGLLAIVPALFLSLWFFLRAPKDSKQTLRDVYFAELLKILLLCVLFVMMLRYGHIHFLPFLAGFCLTYMVYFIAPVVMKL